MNQRLHCNYCNVWHRDRQHKAAEENLDIFSQNKTSCIA